MTTSPRLSGHIPLYITADQVSTLLTWPICIDAVEQAFSAVSMYSKQNLGSTELGSGNIACEPSFAHQPARSITKSGDKSQLLLTMPSFVGNYELKAVRKDDIKRNTLACKVVTSFPRNINRIPPLPNIMANILLFNNETGQLECVMDGTQITAWRTAAASIVATKYLYFYRFPEQTKRPIKLAIIGCGVQGESHAVGMTTTFVITDIYLWNRSAFRATTLAAKLRSYNNITKVHVMPTPQEACRKADVICIGTYSPDPLISMEMLAKDKDIHINAVGAGQVHFGEVAQNVYDNGFVYVDSWANARNELKDLEANIIAEVGEVIQSRKYPDPKSITIFQSMGMSSEDATVAQSVYDVFDSVTSSEENVSVESNQAGTDGQAGDN